MSNNVSNSGLPNDNNKYLPKPNDRIKEKPNFALIKSVEPDSTCFGQKQDNKDSKMKPFSTLLKKGCSYLGKKFTKFTNLLSSKKTTENQTTTQASDETAPAGAPVPVVQNVPKEDQEVNFEEFETANKLYWDHNKTQRFKFSNMFKDGGQGYLSSFLECNKETVKFILDRIPKGNFREFLRQNNPNKRLKFAKNDYGQITVTITLNKQSKSFSFDDQTFEVKPQSTTENSAPAGAAPAVPVVNSTPTPTPEPAPANNPPYDETMCQQVLKEFKQKINEQNADIDSLIKNTLSTHKNPNDKGYLLNEIAYYFYYDSKYTTPNTIETLLEEYCNLNNCNNDINGKCLINIAALAYKLPENQLPKTIATLLNKYNGLKNDDTKGKCLVNIANLASKLPENKIPNTIETLLNKYNDLKDCKDCNDDTKGECLQNIAALAYKLPENKLPKTIKTLFDNYLQLNKCYDDIQGKCLVNIGIAATKTINNKEVINKLQDCINKLPSNIKNNKKFKEDLNLLQQKLQITSVPSELMNLIDTQDEAPINENEIKQNLKEYIENSDSDQNINDKIDNIVTLYNYIENPNIKNTLLKMTIDCLNYFEDSQIKNTLLQTTIDCLNDKDVDCSKMDYTSLINLIKESNNIKDANERNKVLDANVNESNNIEYANERNEIFGANVKLVTKILTDPEDKRNIKNHKIDSIISRLRYLYPNIKDINDIDTKTIKSFTQLLNDMNQKNPPVLTGQTKNKITSLLYQTYKQCDNNNKDLKSKLYNTINKLDPDFIKTKEISIIKRLDYLHSQRKYINNTDIKEINSFTQLLNDINKEDPSNLAAQTKTNIATSLYKIYKQCENNNKDLKSKLHDTIETLVPNFIKTKKTEEDKEILSDFDTDLDINKEINDIEDKWF